MDPLNRHDDFEGGTEVALDSLPPDTRQQFEICLHGEPPEFSELPNVIDRYLEELEDSALTYECLDIALTRELASQEPRI